MTADLQEAPPQSRERLLRRIAKEPRSTATSAPDGAVPEPVMASSARDTRENNREIFEVPAPRRRSWAPALAWTGWAVAAGLAIGGVYEFQSREQLNRQLTAETARANESNSVAAHAQEALATLTDPAAQQITLHLASSAGAPKPEGHAAYLADRGSLVFIANHLEPLQSYKTYELWLLPAEEGGAPVAAGLFKPDAQGNASLVMPNLPKGIKAKGFGVTVEEDGGSPKPTPPILLLGT